MSLTMDINDNNDNNAVKVEDSSNVIKAPAQPTGKSNVSIIEVEEPLLSNLKSILEIITARGGFRAGELSAVGVIYDKLNEVLKKNKPS